MRKRVAEILMTIAKILPFVVMLALVALYLPNKDAVSVEDRNSTRLNSSHANESRMPSSA